MTSLANIHWLFFRQWIVLLSNFYSVMFLFLSLDVNAQFLLSRDVASAFPTDEIIISPFERNTSLKEELFKDDSDGVMAGMRSNISFWGEREEFFRVWSIENSNFLTTPQQEERQRYFQRQALRYVDKRLSGEMREAAEGTVMAQVNQVQNTIRHDSKVQLSKNFRVKFRVRPIQGRAQVVFDNPWVDLNTVFSAAGRKELNIGKTIGSLGIRSYMIYRIDQQYIMAHFDKDLWIPNFFVRFSHHHWRDESPHPFAKDQRVELFFAKSF